MDGLVDGCMEDGGGSDGYGKISKVPFFTN